MRAINSRGNDWLMHHFLRLICQPRLALAASLLALVTTASAFPPALPHTIYGMARDEYGTPLPTNATIVFTSSTGVTLTCQVDPDIAPGVNYRLVVPLDAGLKLDTYRTNAVQGTVPFRLTVSLNGTTLLPLEMVGNYSLLGQPGQQTLINLTLGQDANHDGIPDAWEQAMIAARGWNVGLSALNANWSPASGAPTLMQEYIAGTFGFSDDNGLNLKLARLDAQTPVLEFMAVRGRSYSIVGSSDLKTWHRVPFRFAAPGADPALQENYLSDNVQLLQVAVPPDANPQGFRFFKLHIQ